MAKQPKQEDQLNWRIGFLKAELKNANEGLINTFVDIYKQKKGNWAAIKPALTEDNGFSPDIIESIEYTFHFISAFENNDKINSLGDIAQNVNISTLKETLKASKSGDKKDVMSANKHYNWLFHQKPTKMLVNMIKDPTIPILNNAIGTDVAKVLEKHPDFDIKTTSIYEIIKKEESFNDTSPENREAVIRELKTMQRITAICPTPDAIPILYNAKMHSAFQISELPQAQFIKLMRGKIEDEATINQLYVNAQNTRARNEHALMALRETLKGTGVDMIDKSLKISVNKSDPKKRTIANLTNSTSNETLTKHNLSWDLLFGDADFCECGECNSVYSPAAYFVDLLQYLRNNNLDFFQDDIDDYLKIKDIPKDISNTPLEKLFNRRPDLGCLELTCKNTNTLIPYIDLVNEVMENYIVHKQPLPFNVEDETSGELLAEPQHTEYKAYCILKNSVYPFTIPYHQPIDAARIYLDHLGTSRYELIKTFRKDITNDDKDLTKFNDERLERAADAEFLGLTKEEYIILTKECFVSKELIGKINGKTYSDAEYATKIGVKPVYEYYGFKDNDTVLWKERLPLIKKELLPRTGIDFANLVELLKTAYVNPFMPKGSSKTIMESLRFRYRFLTNYTKVHGINKMAGLFTDTEVLLNLLPKLEGTYTFFIKGIGKKEWVYSKPASEDYEIIKKDIIQWAKYCFEKEGKIIVIENKIDFGNGKIICLEIKGFIEYLFIKDCKIFSRSLDKLNQIGNIDLKDGKITISEKYKPLLKNAIFNGDKGEKGFFQSIGNEFYLILEQSDSCNLETARIQHLDGSQLEDYEYDRIHRFIRLWRKLGWTIEETNQAIIELSGDEQQTNILKDSLCEGPVIDHCLDEDCDSYDEDTTTRSYDINTRLIHQLVAVKKLMDKTGLELTKLLTFWGKISTAGEKSLYQRLFLTHNILGVDKVFKADSNGNYLTGNAKLIDHLPAVMAALNLSAEDIWAIKISDNSIDDNLTLKNLSTFYRYRLLSKVLGVRIPAFTNILKLYGKIFEDASTTLKFMKRWEKMENAGFTHQQLNYIINNTDDEKKPFTPTKKEILLLSKTLYDGLNAIDEAHKDLVADSKITDSNLQEKNIQEQATSELVRTKAGLIFEKETVDKIIGLLDGTNVFKTKAPGNLNFTFEDTDKVKHDKLAETATLKNKLKYDKAGSIQITGILTNAEISTYNSFPNDADLRWNIDPTKWTDSLTRIQNQQEKLFTELLLGIFDINTVLTDAVKDNLKKTIKEGDVSVSLDKLAENENDPNNAPRKRAKFIKVFLPYLRQQLTHRFIAETLTNFTGLDSKITDVLVSQILRLNDKPIYEVFEKIKQSAKQGLVSWNGYLVPTMDSDYTIIVKNWKSSSQIIFENIDLKFDPQDEQDDERWSENNQNLKQLLAGKLYKISIKDIDLKDICWKTPTSTITQVPLSALIPDFTTDDCKPALTKLVKASMLISTFSLGRDEILFFENHKTNFDNLDFNKLTLEQWLRLEAYTRLRNSLPQTDFNILAFWNWTYEEKPDPEELSQKIIDLTTWPEAQIKKLIDEKNFNINKPQDFRDEKNLLKLQKALTVADKIGIDIDLLFEWAVPTSNFKKCRRVADSIKYAIRAKYNQTDWEQVAKPLHDKLRNNQRDALIVFLLQQDELKKYEVTDADGLFEFFLIDVQMDAVMETSRIKQAISSVQLFVQRCFLGLEEEFSGIKSDVLDRKRWDWMQRYRVWEANRKIFLYPENWIESNLRDDKSPFFKELESELLQKDISKQNVTDALKNYLYKVDEVANMEVVGLYIEKKGEYNNQNNRIHVFSRTRNAPYFFYYRYYEYTLNDKDKITGGNWYPWEKVQVDIPSYDAEDPTTHKVTGNGCYLTPVVWNKRLLIFFPQIMKKTMSAPNANVIGTKADGNGNITVAKPSEYYEIKMAWSEYRNGKWTQKQLSKDVVYTDTIDKFNNIQYFKFVPIVEHNNGVRINVDDNLDKVSNKPGIFNIKYDNEYKGAFIFDGQNLKESTIGNTEVMPIVYFNQFVPDIENTNVNQIDLSKTRLYSWQIDSSSNKRVNNSIYFDEEDSKEKINGLYASNIEFYHPYTHTLLGKLNHGNLNCFFEVNLAIDTVFFGSYDDDNNTSAPDIYNELKHPYSIYNWELFFHTPTLLADALSKAQHFEEAMKWYHFVFNPIADGKDLPTEEIDKRFWQFQPFRKIDSQRILESIFNNLEPNKADQRISEWRDKPFMPHLVARDRPVAYMKWVVMKYIDNLLAWGDYLFRQYTIESINQATQIYVIAGHILGPKPMMIPKRGKIKPQTYISLLDKWDAFSNALTEQEISAPYSNQTISPIGVVNNEIAFANIFGVASSLYFCIPNNPKLLEYWDTLADRLFKIRHCQTIEGVFKIPALFEPPIDPALLVKAAAQGLSIASIVNDLNTPMPNYRFYYLLQKALELCNELKSLGGAMLSAIEKKDNEAISLIRAKHEGVMQNLVMEIKKKQLEEAEKSIESLQQNRKSPEERMKYYLKLSGKEESLVPNDTSEFNGIPNDIVTVDGESGLKLIKYEKEEMDKSSEARDKQKFIGEIELTANLFHLLPSLSVDIKPLGNGCGFQYGGPFLGAAAQAYAKYHQNIANGISFDSTNAGKKGGFTRALQERIFQANAAGYELKQIDKQITAQQIRIDIANREIENQKKAIDNATEVEEFLKDKFTNEELYTWMRDRLKTLYHQVYLLAYDLAKKAEKTYCFERGISTANFIQPGYFDAGREGLLAGEQLYVGLKQMEAAYQEKKGYDYEISKQISLRQINPLALIELRETGKCEFALPEVLFDMDYPGHYKRRIKSVSVSIPCIAGPYTGVNATLTLINNKFRKTALGGKEYKERTDETDERFSTHLIPINAIATSSAQNDSGMFELNFKDERYLPFEGAGVISKWRLELPNSFRQFDYNTISDIIIHLRYISSEGGERLKKDASDFVTKYHSSIEELGQQEGLFTIIDLQHDLPNEWHSAMQVNGGYTLTIKNVENFLPYLAKTKNGKDRELDSIAVKDVVIAYKAKLSNTFSLVIGVNSYSFSEGSIGEMKLAAVHEASLELGEWKLTFSNTENNTSEKIERLYMIIRFALI